MQVKGSRGDRSVAVGAHAGRRARRVRDHVTHEHPDPEHRRGPATPPAPCRRPPPRPSPPRRRPPRRRPRCPPPPRRCRPPPPRCRSRRCRSPIEAIQAVGRGDGAATASAQWRLLELGFWLQEPNGDYGLTTQQAVMAFQKYYGLETDGSLGPETAALLTSITERPRPPPMPAPWSRSTSRSSCCSS